MALLKAKAREKTSDRIARLEVIGTPELVRLVRYEERRRERLEQIVQELECECDLDQVCTRCQILNEYRQ